MSEHKWGGMQSGGSPAEASSYEWVRFCTICGIEDTCQDPLPPCMDAREILEAAMEKILAVASGRWQVAQDDTEGMAWVSKLAEESLALAKSVTA